MKTSILLLSILVGGWCFAAVEIQSEFYGPLNLKVWKHWQPSWNVEEVTEDFQFRLTRERDGEKGWVTLRLKGQKERIVSAELQCEALKRVDAWRVEKKVGIMLSSVSVQPENDGVEIKWANADDCIDIDGKNITQKIDVKVLGANNKGLFEYSFIPMYVRGKGQTYWDNAISAYSAHGGKGEIKVATMLSGEHGWDKWNGTLVKPVLSFADRNTMKAGAVIGNHRHENNQEVYLIESGEAKMVMGLAQKEGDFYRAHKTWDDSGMKQETDEFSARGGWKEVRRIRSGEMAVIVPNGSHPDTVYFHGISAINDVVFWTMGSRN